jgi:hypothetical protein
MPGYDDLLQEVSGVLWTERNLLEELAFKLDVQHLVLSSGRTRWLARATKELEAVLDQLRSAELVRAIKIDVLAETLGLAPSPSLAALVAVLPEPWAEIFAQHREAFVASTGEVNVQAEVNRTLLADGRHATRAALAWLENAEGGGRGAAGDDPVVEHDDPTVTPRSGGTTPYRGRQRPAGWGVTG